jgi:hypothetical protein
MLLLYSSTASWAPLTKFVYVGESTRTPGTKTAIFLLEIVLFLLQEKANKLKIETNKNVIFFISITYIK